MRRFGLYNSVKQGKLASEPGESNETIVTEEQASNTEKPAAAPASQPRKKYSAYRTILSRHEEAACRIPDAISEDPINNE